MDSGTIKIKHKHSVTTTHELDIDKKNKKQTDFTRRHIHTNRRNTRELILVEQRIGQEVQTTHPDTQTERERSTDTRLTTQEGASSTEEA